MPTKERKLCGSTVLVKPDSHTHILRAGLTGGGNHASLGLSWGGPKQGLRLHPLT